MSTRAKNLHLSSDENAKERFQILEKLGEGSYGAVLKALDTKDQQLVAIKSIPVDSDVTALQKEIDVLKDCDSQYILQYKGSFLVGDHVWIVLEYCHAGSVTDLMEATGCTLTEVQIAVILRASLLGLAYLHSKRIIHRDIKCGNILLNSAGDPKLGDFGVAAHLTATHSKRQTKIGTPYWMAPEVLSLDSQHDEKADIWSLGITAYEMAIGHPPLTDVHPLKAMFLIPKNPPPTLPDPEKWSQHFHEFVSMCLVKDPTQRPSAESLLKTRFIRNAVGKKAVVKDLVDASMDAITKWRAVQMAEPEDEPSDPDKEDKDDGPVPRVSTIKSSGDTMVEGSTIVRATPSTEKKEKPIPAYMKQFGNTAELKAEMKTGPPPASTGPAPPPAPEENTPAAFYQYFVQKAPLYPISPTSTYDALEKLLKWVTENQKPEVRRLATFFEESDKAVNALMKTFKKTQAKDPSKVLTVKEVIAEAKGEGKK